MVAKKDLVVGKHNALIAMVRDMSTDMELYQKEVEIAERKSPPVNQKFNIQMVLSIIFLNYLFFF